MAVSDEDIETWMHEGWKFRIKNSHGKQYITRRKGKLERSLGAYDDDLWKRITSQLEESGKEKSKSIIPQEVDSLKEELQKLSRRLDDLSSLLPETVHGKKWWLFTKIGHFTRQITALKKQDEELENRLKGYESRLSECQMNLWKLDGLGKLEASMGFLRESAARRVRDDNNGCLHIGPDGYCTFWFWNQRQLGKNQKEDHVTDHGITKRVWRDNVKANPEICASCPSYKPRGD